MIKEIIIIIIIINTNVQFELVFLLHDSLEQNYSKRKEEKYRIKKGEPKKFQSTTNDEENELKKYRKNYTYKICKVTPDTTKRLIYMEKKNFIINWTENNKLNEQTKIDNNDHVTLLREQSYRKNTHTKKG